MYDRFRLLKIFVTTAHSESFRDAAFQLGTSPQTISRAVKELEDQLGELLFHRSTRQIQITKFGEQFLSESSSLMAELELLFEQSDTSDNQRYAGRVGITAPHSVGRRHILPLLEPLIRAAPECLIDLRLEDEVTDTVGAQIDIGIRVGALLDNRFVAREAAKVPLMVVATPKLIARVGEPKRISDLMTRPVSGRIDRNSGRVWPWRFNGFTHTPHAPRFLSDDPEAELQAVMNGWVFGQIAAFLVIPYIREGLLVPVLREFEPPPLSLFVYRPQRGPVPPRVRRVFDTLSESFADEEQFPSLL
ncbi:DNA-binding transcriptional regulator, LysR family [Marinobacter daqiaonensis]|uniref:DNA-binding transcriptional regulator, LysR family n=1 Tax=Marinobacter daqiaonensis TaxID=650891 RepID=A0A1I6HSY8_9GAMM|nr:LysR family transcriptional regulator [Marinobacter daqiaonensis]SFR57555.1 DNA-binding transcriptional regulator, LysR family [Marinobacter daqiaonensis]